MLDADTDFYFIAKHTADKNGPLQNLKWFGGMIRVMEHVDSIMGIKIRR